MEICIGDGSTLRGFARFWPLEPACRRLQRQFRQGCRGINEAQYVVQSEGLRRNGVPGTVVKMKLICAIGITTLA